MRLEGYVAGQINQLFGEIPLEFSWWQEMSIREVIIHGAQPRGARIADPTRLDGRRFAHESRQAIEPRVTRQIDENVDAIIHDLIRQRRVREGANRMPAPHQTSQAPA